jgi:soluble lytic murein transglycosylase-like protein
VASRKRASARARRPRHTKLRGAFAALLLALIVGATVATWKWKPIVRAARDYQSVRRVEGWREVLIPASRESGVDPNLLAAVMFVESRGNAGAVSPVGALGLFQLMPATAQERAELLDLPSPSRKALLSDPLLNARIAADYLRWLLRRYSGDVERALIAYNAGPGRLERWIKRAGSYAAWRDERERAGNSDVLAYARTVQDLRERFARRAVIAPMVDQPQPAPPAASDTDQPLEVGPPTPPHAEDDLPVRPADSDG